MALQDPPAEEALRAPVARYLAAQGYAVHHEVRFNGRIADVLGVQGDDVVAVELKLSDWRGAHVQAKAYQVGARRTFVALPLHRIPRIERRGGLERFHASGVGLLGVPWPQGDVRCVLDARSSDRTLPFLAHALQRGAIPREARHPWRRFR